MQELVLTGYEEFLPRDKNGKAVFLGPWCFGGNSIFTFEEQTRHQVLSFPYKNWNEVLDASRVVEELIERILDCIVPILNGKLEVELTRKYWEKVFITRLVYLIGMLYDRYLNLKKLKESKISYIIKIVDCSEYLDFTFKERQVHFNSLFYNEANLFIFSQFLSTLKGFENHNLIPIKLDINFWRKTGLETRQNKTSFLSNAKRRLGVLFNSSSKIYLGNINGLNYLDKLYLRKEVAGWKDLFKDTCKNLKIISKHTNNKSIQISSLSLGLTTQNEFEEWINKYLLNFLHIPDKQTIERAMHTNLKVWIGNDIYSGKELDIASISEKKGKWVSVQHGGGYGQLLSLVLGRIEYKCADQFLSWGWEYNHEYETNNIKYLPSPQLSKIKNYGNAKAKREIILISTSFPIYLYKFQTCLRPEQQLDFIEAKINFINNLSKDANELLYYRPYPDDYGKNENYILQKYITNVDNKKYFLPYSIYSKYKLVVIDHMATSHLYSFVMNIPTILFFKREHFEYNRESEPFFQKLMDAEILFHDETLAAKKVNEIYSDPHHWWNLPKVQKAKDDFCFKYARTSSHWREEWITYLKTTISKG